MSPRCFWLALLAALATAACHGVNADCRWPEHAVRPLDMADAVDRRHLVEDVETVEALAIRYGHIRWRAGDPRWLELDERCTTGLHATIADEHNVSFIDISSAEARLNERGLNLAVNIPILLVYVWLARTAMGAMYRRFSWRDEPAPLIASGLLLGILVSGIVTGVGGIWEVLYESMRLGDGHLAHRTLRLQWHRYRTELFVVGALAFWCAAVTLPTVVKLAFARRDLAGTDLRQA